MRSVKSINSLNSNHQQIQQQQQQAVSQHNQEQFHNAYQQQTTNEKCNPNGNTHQIQPSTSPICRCRVMYLGSSVPHITKDGLQGIQEPLKVLYPDKTALSSGNAGIDSWLSVWSNGILIENVDEAGKEVKKFFKIDALHYCAAVKYVPLPLRSNINPYTTLPNNNSLNQIPKFLPLDSPHARQPNPNPPVFASILRRTTGIKVLECHAFICKREAAANALVRCCFHAYADTMYAKQIGADVNDAPNNQHNHHSLESTDSSEARSQPSTITSVTQQSRSNKSTNSSQSNQAMRRAKSIGNMNEAQSDKEIINRSVDYQEDGSSLLIRPKSMNGNLANNTGGNNNLNLNANKFDNEMENITSIQKQQRLSKSMYHLNNLNDKMIQQSYHNPYASRVPSYPPQNIINNSIGNGGTLRSIKSMAANSIASTLLRSKKHAKAMSMAQLNQEKLMQQNQPTPQLSNPPNPFILPPIPAMFLPNISARTILNGSQTMKPMGTNRPRLGAPNFEAISHKELKKLLKKNAKYGLEPSKFPENGLPSMLPIHSSQMPIPMLPSVSHSKSGTMMTSTSMFSDIYGPPIPPPPMPHMINPMSINGPPLIGNMQPRTSLPNSPDQSQMKQILVKPSSEFLKSKAGKKWLKQQKQFKKLLPPHLDGLPIVFGPPPVEALEAANIQGINGPNPNISMSHLMNSHPGLPMMDSFGYYNQNPYLQNNVQNGRASAASTLLRYSPHSQLIHEQNLQQHDHHMIHHDIDNVYGLPPHFPIMYNVHPNHQSPSFYNSNHIIGDDLSMTNGSSNASEILHHRRHLSNQRFISQQKQRNQMVEQSVISLGDENDYDEDDINDNGQHPDYYRQSDQQPGNSNNSGYVYDDVNGQENNPYGEMNGKTLNSKRISSVQNLNQHINNHHTNHYINDQLHPQTIDSNGNNYRNEKTIYDSQPTYSQVSNLNNDDQGSYSSGIYRREHIGERAFSYSIRQEHKSNGQPEYDRLEGQNHYQVTNQDQSDDYYHTVSNQDHDVDEVGARLENQLSMKSFANSKMKSHVM